MSAIVTFNGPESVRASLAAHPAFREKWGTRSDRPQFTEAQFMAELRYELKHAANLSDEQIAAYTEDCCAWLEYKADGYSPLEAVEADMEHWV
jgi:hypothetical protein